MSQLPEINSIYSRILKTENINWHKLLYIQHDAFKDFSEDEKKHLKTSLVQNGFADPYNIWEDAEGKQWCLDGYHRSKILEELIAEGIFVPDQLPANFISCADKKEAAKMVLIYSSRYARITAAGLQLFSEQYNIKLEEMKDEIILPELINIIPENLEYPDELIGDPKNKPASMKITFPNADKLEQAKPLIEDLIKTKFPDVFFSVSCGEI